MKHNVTTEWKRDSVSEEEEEEEDEEDEQEEEKKRGHVHCWTGCELVQQLCKVDGEFPHHSTAWCSYNPAIPLPGL